LASLASVRDVGALKRWNLTDEIPRRLPILDRWLERAARDRPLAGVTVLNIQHQLGNHLPQTTALLELGVSPRDVYWIDIPYTSTPVVREALYGLGIPAGNVAISDFRALDKYGPFQRSRVQRFVLERLDDPPERLLVLDDGSYMLSALAGLRRRLPSVVIVEQTTRGLIKIEENAALEHCSRELTVVDVARSTPMATLEPPFIGVAVVEALRRRLAPVLSPGRGIGAWCSGTARSAGRSRRSSRTGRDCARPRPRVRRDARADGSSGGGGIPALAQGARSPVHARHRVLRSRLVRRR